MTCETTKNTFEEMLIAPRYRITPAQPRGPISFVSGRITQVDSLSSLAFFYYRGYPYARQAVTPFHKGEMIMAKAKAKAPASEKREYKTPESAAKQKAQWEKKGYKVTRKGNFLYLKKG